MALIVDDTVDVWANDLANFCPTRRFVGDPLDDGLQLLSWQLATAHRMFYADAPPEGYSLAAALAGTPRAPPSVFSVLADARGQLLAGSTIALTGVVNGLGHEDGLEQVPLGVLIQLFGGQLTTSLDGATHLVARRKDGWRDSPKIRKALRRLQARHTPLLTARALRAKAHVACHACHTAATATHTHTSTACFSVGHRSARGREQAERGGTFERNGYLGARRRGKATMTPTQCPPRRLPRRSNREHRRRLSTCRALVFPGEGPTGSRPVSQIRPR